MRKILLIDKGDSSIQKFRKSLSNRGCLIINEQDLKRAVPYLKKSDIDLIIIDNTFLSKKGNSGEFRQLSADTPKIVLTDRGNLQDKKFWRKDRLVIHVCEPVSLKEFRYWSDKLLKDKLIEDENRLLLAELKNRKKELKFHDDISKNLAETFELKTSLTAMMEKTRVLAKAEAWSLLLNDDSLFKIIPLRPSKKIQITHLDEEVGIAGWVLEKRMQITVQNVQKDRRFNKKVDGFPGLRVKSLMCAPVRIKDKVLGVIRLINSKHAPSEKKASADIQAGFSEDNMSLLLSAANYIGIAIERTFLYQKTKNDDLTNLYNVHYLNQALDVEIERSRRYRSMFSLVFMDIDNFKVVNDKYGHLIGSKVLIEMAQLLQKSLRKIDVITRYGGDEFVIILPLTPPDSAFLVADRLRKSIEKNIFLKYEGIPIRLTASFGVASYPVNAKNREELLKIADDAMYHGKFSTKNIVHAAK